MPVDEFNDAFNWYVSSLQRRTGLQRCPRTCFDPLGAGYCSACRFDAIDAIDLEEEAACEPAVGFEGVVKGEETEGSGGQR